MPILIPTDLFAQAPAPTLRHLFEVDFNYALRRDGVVSESGGFDAWPEGSARTTPYGWLLVGRTIMLDSDRDTTVLPELEPYGCRLLGGVLEAIYPLLPKLAAAITQGEMSISAGPYSGESEALNPHGKARFVALVTAGGTRPAIFISAGINLLVSESYNTKSLTAVEVGAARGLALRREERLIDPAHAMLAAQMEASFVEYIQAALTEYRSWVGQLGAA